MRSAIFAFILLFVSIHAGTASDSQDISQTVLDAVPGNETAVYVERVANDHLAILGAVQTSENRVRLYLLNNGNALLFSRPLSLNLTGDEFAGTLAPVDAKRFLATYVSWSAGQARTVVALIRLDGGLDWQMQLPSIGNTLMWDRPPRVALGAGGLVVVAYAALGQTHLARLSVTTGAFLGETIWEGELSAPFGLDVAARSIWVGGEIGSGLQSRYGLAKFDLSGKFLWARSQTQDVINILGPAWIHGLKDGTAVVVAGEEGPFGSHRTTITLYAGDGTVLNRRMDPPATENNGGILGWASILPNGVLSYAIILGSEPFIKLGNANGSIIWEKNLSGELGSGSALPVTIDLDPETFRTAILHDSIGSSALAKSGAILWDSALPISGEAVRSVWIDRQTIATVVNTSSGGGQQITVFSQRR
jgi:hypothetical protein